MWYCHTFFHVDAAWPYVKIPPIGEEIRIHLLTPLCIILEYTIPRLLKDCVLVSTARNPFVYSCVKLFSNNSSLDNSSFGELGPSLEEWVEFTAEFGVDWKVTLLWAGEVCGADRGLLIFLWEIVCMCDMFDFNLGWCVTINGRCVTINGRKQIGIVWWVRMWVTWGMCVIDAAKVLWLKLLLNGFYINCCNSVTNAGNCCYRKFLIVFVCNFCSLIWLAGNVIYQRHSCAWFMFNIIKSKGKRLSTQRVKRLLYDLLDWCSFMIESSRNLYLNNYLTLLCVFLKVIF